MSNRNQSNGKPHFYIHKVWMNICVINFMIYAFLTHIKDWFLFCGFSEWLVVL